MFARRLEFSSNSSVVGQLAIFQVGTEDHLRATSFFDFCSKHQGQISLSSGYPREHLALRFNVRRTMVSFRLIVVCLAAGLLSGAEAFGILSSRGVILAKQAPSDYRSAGRSIATRGVRVNAYHWPKYMRFAPSLLFRLREHRIC